MAERLHVSVFPDTHAARHGYRDSSGSNLELPLAAASAMQCFANNRGMGYVITASCGTAIIPFTLLVACVSVCV